LWVTDGDPAHTALLASGLSLAFNMSGSQRFAVLGDQVVFVAVDAAHGAELWRSDGTPGGTSLLQDVVPGPESLDPDFLVSIDGALLFGVRHGTEAGLWRSDGAAAGTQRIGAAAPIRPPVPVGAGVVFKALGATGGYEIWHTDGTSGGTQRVAASAFGDIVGFDDAAYYLAGVNDGCVLMRTGGTQATTSEVLRINAPREALGGSCLGEMAVAGGQLFFAAEDVHGGEPWRSDGTAAGTQLVRDVRDGTSSAEARNLLDFQGRLLFLADDDQRYGPELWTSDGSSAGTRRFIDPPLSSAWEIFRALGDRVLFQQSPSFLASGPPMGR
jgi:ELWxxDGT repeat protein